MPPVSEQRVDHSKTTGTMGSGQSSEKSPYLSSATCLTILPMIFFSSKNLWKKKLVWEWTQDNPTTTNNMRLKKASIEIISRSAILGKRETILQAELTWLICYKEGSWDEKETCSGILIFRKTQTRPEKAKFLIHQNTLFVRTIFSFYLCILPLHGGFPCGSIGEESACHAGDPVSIPESGRFPGEGHGNPLQYSCLENPMDRGAWQATVHGVAKSWTRLSD